MRPFSVGFRRYWRIPTLIMFLLVPLDFEVHVTVRRTLPTCRNVLV